MFKRMLVIYLLIFGMMVGGAGATEFNTKYVADPECFMTLDYTECDGSAPNIWVVTSTDTMINRKYLRLDGKIWRGMAQTKEMVLPCRDVGIVAPVWLCPKLEPVVLAVVPPAITTLLIERETKAFVVHFDFNSDILTEDATYTLSEIASYVQENGYENVKLASYCDFRGSGSYNIELGERRVTTVTHWLIENGVSPSAFEVENYGDSLSPMRIMKGVLCADCWEDRKVEVIVE